MLKLYQKIFLCLMVSGFLCLDGKGAASSHAQVMDLGMNGSASLSNSSLTPIPRGPSRTARSGDKHELEDYEGRVEQGEDGDKKRQKVGDAPPITLQDLAKLAQDDLMAKYYLYSRVTSWSMALADQVDALEEAKKEEGRSSYRNFLNHIDLVKEVYNSLNNWENALHHQILSHLIESDSSDLQARVYETYQRLSPDKAKREAAINSFSGIFKRASREAIAAQLVNVFEKPEAHDAEAHYRQALQDFFHYIERLRH